MHYTSLTTQTCQRCGGSGRWGRCFSCGGSGSFGYGYLITCPTCSGSGIGKCPQCNGTGIMNGQNNPAGAKPPMQTSSVEFQPSGRWYARAYDISKNQIFFNPQMGDTPLIYDLSSTGCSCFMAVNLPGGGKREAPGGIVSWSYDPVSRTLKLAPDTPGMIIFTMASQIEDKFLFKSQIGYFLFSRT